MDMETEMDSAKSQDMEFPMESPLANENDLNFLVNETLSNSEGKGLNPFQTYSSQQIENNTVLSAHQFEEHGSCQCGVFYFVDKKGTGIFVRCFASKNFYLDQEDMRKKIIQKYPHVAEQEISCFSTEYYELAQIISENFSSKRIALPENSLLEAINNEMGWWMEEDSQEIKIYFRRPRSLDYQQWLGPIGDCRVAFFRFQKILELFRQHRAIDVYTCQEEMLQISSFKENNPLIQSLINLMKNGVVEKDFINSWEKILGPTLSIYLNELATLRCFWMQIQSGLDSE